MKRPGWLPILGGGDRQLADVAPANRPTKQPSGGAVGVDGVSPYSDLRYGGPDVNPELMGRSKYAVYQEMRLTDAAVKSLGHMVKLPIRSAEYGLVPSGRDPDGEQWARRRADFAAWQFGLEGYNTPRLDLTWDELNQQDLFYLDYGAMGAEYVWPDATEEWRDADGNPWTALPLARLAPRFASSVADIEVDPKSGQILRIRQDLPGADWIPGPASPNGGKLMWLVNEREGDNWFGMSFLRVAYGPWLMKKELMISGAIGFGRFQAGTPWITHPVGTEAEKKAQDIGRSMAVHERAWIATPGPPASAGGEWDVQILNGAATLGDPVPMLRYYDQQIAMGGLQQFSSLGTTETGSRAVGETLSEPFYLAVQAIAKGLVLARMRYPLRRLFDINFGPEVPVPEIVVSKIQGRNVAVLARALADLSAAGLVFTDRGTQNDVRDMLDLQHLPEPVAAAIGQLPEDVGVTPVPGVSVPVEGGSIAVSRPPAA